MKLRLWHIVREEEKHVSINDERRRVNYVLAAYIGPDNREYRKSFESYTKPVVPIEGTHEYLNSLAIQYNNQEASK